MREAIDHNARNCVRRELDKILHQARHLLEDYDANPDDADLLNECAAHIRELLGPLQILEVQGADLLAREMEQVIDALLQNMLEQPAAALELIMQALLQLPAYLSGLHSGKQEDPALLLPLVNSMRLVRSTQPLNESAVFSPDISAPMPGSVFDAQSAADKEDTRQIARAERRRFQAGLLEWFRSGTESAGFQSLFEVLEHLQAGAAREPLARLWWISAGVVEALSTGVLADSPEIKRLFGWIDRQIKYLADKGEAAVDQVPAELLRGLLYQLACAGNREGRIDLIKATYRLDECLPTDADHDALKNYPGGYPDELLQSVSDNLRDAIVRIKDQLNDIHDHEQCVPAVLASVVNDLHMLGNALDMVGMEALGARLAEQERLLSAAADTNSAVAGTSIADLASTLGVMEDMLAVTGCDLTDPGTPDNAVYRQDHGEVVRNVIELMMLAKSALNDCVKSPKDLFLLDPVPGFLSQVQSGLQILGQQRAAAVLAQVEEFIAHELMASRSMLLGDQLDDLADAISCVDYYIEELGDNRIPGDMMLEIAESSMARLGYHFPAMVDGEAGNYSAEVVNSNIDSHCSEAGTDNQSSRAISAEEPEGDDQACVETAEFDMTQAEDASAAGDVDDELPVLSVAADPEIVEIFLEEAAEELETLSKALPAWLGNPADVDTLEAIRRSFHTLKGSGRMAGAMRAGEFSWSIESLLNKVLDGSIEPGGPVCDLLGQVLEPLAQLMEQISGGSTPAIDVQALMAHAEVLVSGNRTEFMDEPSGDDADAEPALFDIFKVESLEQLQSIKEFLAAYTTGCVVTEPVFRALHTITGISETAGATSINMLTTGIYSYFDELYQLQWPVDTVAFEVLREYTEAIDDLLQDDPLREVDAEWLSGLRASIASLPALESEQQVVQQVADDTEAGTAGDVAEVVAAGAGTCAMAGAGGDPVIAHDGDDDPYADMDPELVEIFIEEAAEIIDSIENIQRSWAADPLNSGHLDEFQRQLHTLKGGARMVNIGAIGDLSHALESLLTEVADARISTSDSLFSLLIDVQDGLAGMLEQVRQRQLPVAAVDLLAALSRIQQQPESDPVATAAAVETEPLPEAEPAVESGPGTEAQAAPEVEPGSDTEPEVEPGPQTETDIDPGQLAGKAPAGASARSAHNAAMIEKMVLEGDAVRHKAERRKTSRVRGDQVRVPASLLDDMVNLAGEITIYRSRIDQQVSDYHFNLNELEQTIGRLHEQLRLMEIETETQIQFRFEQEADNRDKEFDLLEMDRYSNLQQLSRSMIESISDLRSISELMDGAVRESEVLLLQQSRVNTKLQDGLIRTRMIPFIELAPRLRRVLRQAAQALGKEADLGLEGAEGEMDRTVVERIIAPLEHMLRNAVAHGIETPEQRRQAGKAETGTVTISMQREGSEIVLRISDDGAGVDLEAIRSRALERGLLEQDKELSDNDIMQFILQTGFSTAGEVTQISGRGVGMDIVNSEVKQLGGSLQIDSTRGTGTAVTMRLPYTLAINKALLVKAGEETFCIPLAGIEGVVNIEASELMHCHDAGGSFDYAGKSYRLQHLGTMLGTGGMEPGLAQESYSVLLVRIGNKRMAIQVDALMGSREIVIKPLGAQLSTVDGISGATILGDGRVVLILDLAAVSAMNTRAQPQETKEPEQTSGKLVVMVVDDSITVRKVTTRLLERKGFKVLSAKDGVDAMGQLQETVPDIILLDVEMPRMDGFELATHIRNDGRLQKIPIIMITSRTGDKHRERARQIGVNSYLGKPYRENDLLDSISTLMGVSAEATAT